MPGKHRTISIFLRAGICFILILASAYSHYNTLIEADFITHGTKIEDGDVDNLWVDRQINLDFSPSESLIIILPQTSRHGFFIMPQVVSINYRLSVLRC